MSFHEFDAYRDMVVFDLTKTGKDHTRLLPTALSGRDGKPRTPFAANPQVEHGPRPKQCSSFLARVPMTLA